MATGHKTCRGKGDDACDSLLRHVMSRVWRPESGTACCWLHPAKVKMNRRDAVGCVPRRCCRAAERVADCCSVALSTWKPGSASRTGPALPEPGRRDGDPGIWTGPARWEQDSRSSVARTDAISAFAPKWRCQNPSLREIQDSKTRPLFDRR